MHDKEQSTIADIDPPCRLCQYNLRGLSAEALCPECGTPVRLSVLGDRLRSSNPAYVWTLRRGALCVMWAMIALVIFSVLGTSLFKFYLRGTLPATLCSLAINAVDLYGLWLLTTPDPGGLGEREYGRSRKFIRLVTVVSLAEIVLNVPLRSIAFPPVTALTIAALRGAVSLLLACKTIALLTYLSKLASRLPDDRIARRASRLRFTFGSLVLLFAVIGVTESIAALSVTAQHRQQLLRTLTFAIGLIAILLLIFGIFYLLLLDKLANHLRTAARDAEQLWTTAGANA